MKEQMEIKCLDYGFVRLVDYMGCDEAIVQAARVSYGSGTTKKSRDEELIRYLMRHKHFSPFEMCEIKFHIKLPIFVARQMIRHRTANVNEYSLRYSEAISDFYTPELDQFRKQDNKKNFQGKTEEIIENPEEYRNVMEHNRYDCFESYKDFIKSGLARELSRIVLPVSNYTMWYWKMDLRNLFNFLSLRMESHAQYEIRVYAEAIYSILKELFPISMKAFDDYILNARTFSKMEIDAIKSLLNKKIDLSCFGMDTREKEEFLEKLGNEFRE